MSKSIAYLSTSLAVIAALQTISVKRAHAADPTMLSVPAKLAAALVVACNDYAAAAGTKDAPLSIDHFAREFVTVSLAEKGEDAVVRFHPPRHENALGGSVLYVIDINTFAVKKRVFGK